MTLNKGLSEEELASRWRLSRRTLQRWRNKGRCPPYILLGRKIIYTLSDIEAFEARCRIETDAFAQEPGS